MRRTWTPWSPDDAADRLAKWMLNAEPESRNLVTIAHLLATEVQPSLDPAEMAEAIQEAAEQLEEAGQWLRQIADAVHRDLGITEPAPALRAV